MIKKNDRYSHPFVWCRQGRPSPHPTPVLAMSHLHLTEVPVESYFQPEFETIFTSFCLCMCVHFTSLNC